MNSFKNDIFSGKTILISGGATGICYEISRAFLELGALVYIISRKIDNIQKAIQKLKHSTGKHTIYGSSCDVRRQKEVEDTVQMVVTKFGKIDVLVNGAAGNFLCPFQNLSPNGFKTVLMIDTVGTFLLSKYTNQYGFKSGGVIINISANLYYNGTALQTHSGTAKAGVDALTKHLAVELGPKNIRVCGVCPGIIEKTEGFERLSAGQQINPLEIIPLQRLGKSKDVAHCVVFLSSPLASYITGITVQVDGGQGLTCPNFPFHSSAFRKTYASNSKAKL